jgi:hypothetical protein
MYYEMVAAFPLQGKTNQRCQCMYTARNRMIINALKHGLRPIKPGAVICFLISAFF